MAGIKISQLPAVASSLLTDFFPVVQGGVTSQATLSQVATLFGMTGGILAMSAGGTGANLTAANGAIPYSSATAIALLAAGTTGQLFRSGGVGAPTWTTSTYPATNAINTLLYASSANVMAALATANSGVLITSAGGVPSISSALPGGLTVASDPTVALGIATKQYVDQTALNGTSVYAASTGSLGTVTQSGAGVGATLTNAGAQATFALDGVNPPVGSNVLIKDTSTGATAANEGIYTVTNVGSGATNWVLTRATSYDTPTEINNTGLIIVDNGSTLAGTAWYNSATIVTVDTTNFSFSQFGNNSAITQVKAQTFTSGTSTYTPTASMKYCTVEIVGGGGGGGGAAASGGAGNQSAGAGGGGGGYCRKTYTAALIGANATVVVGAAANGGTAGNNNGTAGNNSTFTPAGAGVVLTAGGGGAGNGSAANAGTGGWSAVGGAGGTATNGDLSVPGTHGGNGWIIGGANFGNAGYGGASLFGSQTPDLATSAGNGTNGANYGSGGSGGADGGTNNTARTGGNGSAGFCIITEYI